MEVDWGIDFVYAWYSRIILLPFFGFVVCSGSADDIALGIWQQVFDSWRIFVENEFSC